MLVAQLCLTLRDPMDGSPPGSCVHGILQARILEWVAIPFSRVSFWPRDWTWVFCIAGGFFTIWATREALYNSSVFLVMDIRMSPACESEVTQLCQTLCDSMDCSLPGYSIYGIFQARVLEWVAISFPRGSYQPRDWTWVSWIAGRFFTDWATKEAPAYSYEQRMLL